MDKTQTSDLYEVLYLSTLAPGAPLRTVANIASRARQNNQALGITGLLVFDGQRFCHFIEGGRKQVLALTERITRDPRHVDMDILRHAPAVQRRFRCFGLGYTAVEDEEVLARLKDLGSDQAVAEFLALAATVDLDS